MVQAVPAVPAARPAPAEATIPDKDNPALPDTQVPRVALELPVDPVSYIFYQFINLNYVINKTIIK